MSEIQAAEEVGGGVVGFWSCSPLKGLMKDGTKEAASKAQAIAATHALHAFRIPKGKEWGGVLRRGEMACLVNSALVQQLCQKESTEKDDGDSTPLNS